MKQKALAVLLTAVLAAGMMTGCGQKETSQETKTEKAADKKGETVSDEEAVLTRKRLCRKAKRQLLTPAAS